VHDRRRHLSAAQFSFLLEVKLVSESGEPIVRFEQDRIEVLTGIPLQLHQTFGPCKLLQRASGYQSMDSVHSVAASCGSSWKRPHILGSCGSGGIE
jgi:hypothetical protein